MGGELPKQYMNLCGKPLISWTLNALGCSDVIDDIVIVIPEGDEGYVKSHVLSAVEERAADKVRGFVAGGAERYNSVYKGLQAIAWECDYVFIHDGARPFIDEPSLERLQQAVKECDACVAGMPSKDTVKIADEDGFVADTPDRTKVWIIQTPQVFRRELITEAYKEMIGDLPELTAKGVHITDDAMAAELMRHAKVKLVKASYRNIKITTPDDLAAAENFLREANQS